MLVEDAAQLQRLDEHANWQSIRPRVIVEDDDVVCLLRGRGINNLEAVDGRWPLFILQRTGDIDVMIMGANLTVTCLSRSFVARCV